MVTRKVTTTTKTTTKTSPSRIHKAKPAPAINPAEAHPFNAKKRIKQISKRIQDQDAIIRTMLDE